MRDEIFDRDYQAGRAELNDGIDRGLARIRAFLKGTFEAIHRRQWAAPWRRAPSCN